MYKETSPELQRILQKLITYCRKHDEQVLTTVKFSSKGFNSTPSGKGLIVCLYMKSETADEIVDYLCKRLGIDPNTGEHWQGKQ